MKGTEINPWGQSGRRERRGGGTRGGQGPLFKRECSKCAQEMLLVATDEDASCQDPKGRPGQVPEYEQRS